MNLKQIFGIFLLIVGVGAIIYGLSIQDSVEYKFATAFGGDTSRVALLIIGGIIASVAGVLMLVFGRDKVPAEEHFFRPTEREPAEESLDILQFDDERLTQIVESSDFYRSEVVEASRRELQMRRKCEELLPQLREKDDCQLQRMISNPTFYTEELIRTARIVQDERRRMWQQKQERAEQAACLERAKQANERRIQRNAALKKMRPYFFTALAVLAVAAAGTGYYMYRQQQERLAMERRAAEERRIARQKKAEGERAAQERWAEEQKIADERKRAAAERQQQEVKKILADKNYRRSVGAYLVGEYHEALGGIVFYVDNTYKHGKVISILHTTDNDKRGKDWDETVKWCKSLGGKWRLPTIQEWELIYKLFYEQSITTDRSLGIKQGYSFGESAYWSSSKWNNENDNNWVFRFDKGCKEGSYHNWSVYARAVSSF